MSNIILKLINIFTVAICLIMVFRAVLLNKTVVTKESLKMPGINPAQINLLVHGYNHAPRIITAQILDLAAKNNIDVKLYMKGEKPNLKFKRISDDSLSISERAFMDMLFMGKEENDTEELKKLTSTSDTLIKLQSNWLELLEKEIKDMGLYDSDKKSLAGKYNAVGAISAIFGAISLFSGHFIGFFALIAAIFVIFMGLNFGLQKSDKGYMITNYWQDKLKNYEAATENYTERDFIDAVALNLPMENLEKIYEKLEPSQKTELIEEFVKTNPQGGSLFDDACFRAILGFEKPTTAKQTETLTKLLKFKSPGAN